MRVFGKFFLTFWPLRRVYGMTSRRYPLHLSLPSSLQQLPCQMRKKWRGSVCQREELQWRLKNSDLLIGTDFSSFIQKYPAHRRTGSGEMGLLAFIIVFMVGGGPCPTYVKTTADAAAFCIYTPSSPSC
ncbi:hypothetical protein BDW42DRAFT_69854 [Aspergillus taichungensis]|uniref:Uncharacterized protein n=1 Tax=Aspergillus taichungensis TaxID=482145 RepID=A0A2J5HZQ2_9EURO|nr:hypothetical protein BDW42DRAFT_69854 [Aspergillus taichungensis]